MDKNEYRAKLDNINDLVDRQDYEGALKIVDTIDWRRVRSARTLCMVGEIYEANKRYEDSRKLLVLAHQRAPIGKTVLYRLVELSIKMGEFDDAVDYYEQFVDISPNDNSRYILKYKIYRGRRSPLQEQIAILEDYKSREYTERWAYELARLYAKAGMKDKCVEECDDLILWFSEGKYVTKAMELKMKYAPLSPSQEQSYRNRYVEPAPEKTAATIAAATQAASRLVSQTGNILQGDTVSLQETVRPKESILQQNTAELTTDELPPIESVRSRVTGKAPEETSVFTPILETTEALQDRIAKSIRDVFSGGVKAEKTEDNQETEEEYSAPKNTEDYVVKELEPENLNNAKTITPSVIESVSASEAKAEKSEAIPVEEVDLEALLAETAGEMAQVVAEETRKDSVAETEEVQEEVEPEAEVSEAEEEIEPTAEAEEIEEAEPMAKAEEAEEEANPETETPEAEEEVEATAEAEEIEEAEPMAEVEEAEEEANPETEIPEAEEEVEATAEGEEIEEAEPVAEVEEAEEEANPETETPEAEEEVEATAEAEEIEEAEPMAEVEEAEEEANPETETPEAEEEIEPTAEAEEIEEAKPMAEAEEPKEESEPASEIFFEEGPLEAPAGVDESDDVEAAAEPYESVEEDSEVILLQRAVQSQLDTSIQEEAAASLEPGVIGGRVVEVTSNQDTEKPADQDGAALGGMTIDLQRALAEALSENGIEVPAEEAINQEILFRQAMNMEEPEIMTELEDIVIPESASVMEPEVTAEPETAEPELPKVDIEPKAAVTQDTIVMNTAASAPKKEDVQATQVMPKVKPQKQNVKSDNSPVGTAMEEILRYHLTKEEQKRLFTYFAPIPGMTEQISETLDIIQESARQKTSRSGNIIITGREGSGKTKLSEGLIKAICKERRMQGARIAYVNAEKFNKKDPAYVVDKLAGGFLVVEKASALKPEVIEKLSKAMEFKTNRLTVILEDLKPGIKALEEEYPEFMEKFDSRIVVPVFTNDELVSFAKTYSKEMGYKIEDMAVLALYTLIGDNQYDDDPVTVSQVKEMMDEAIKRASRGGRRPGRKVAKRHLDDSGRIMLYEKDFDI